jgi:hypothetical protein
MKRLPFTVRKVVFRVGLESRPGMVQYQVGVICDHYVRREKSYFSGEWRWNRYYGLIVQSGPSAVVGSRVDCFAEWVFRWPHVRE